MNTYYIAELQNKNSYRKAEQITAKDLTSAKRIAGRGQFFQGTVMEIGLSVDNNGFITTPIARKINGKWN
jgi:hypothetical protein